MTVWHVVLSIALVVAVILIAMALPKWRRRRPEDHSDAAKDTPNLGMSYDRPQQEVARTPQEQPKSPERGDDAKR